MPRRPTVVLFDIDGTLVTCGGAGRRAMERAFREHTDEHVSGFSFGGMTDRAIVRQALAAARVAIDDAILERTLEHYLAHLADELPRSSGYSVLAGVEGALEMLEVEQSAGTPVALGLGTGNLVRGAELKLRPADLWRRFSFGGFGSDDEDRPTLLRHGERRGAARLGLDPSTVATIVIGDTPRDIQAARAIGARCVAVASGSFDRASLEREGADHVLDSLLELELSHVLG
jgi:phosphoglycolate phosphatase-like HAD superfamily hydrolase